MNTWNTYTLNTFAFQIAEEGTEADRERQGHSW